MAVADNDSGEERGGHDRLTDCIGLGVLTRVVHRDLVDEVLTETGAVERRRRLLPTRVMVYFVSAMALFLRRHLRRGDVQVGAGTAVSAVMGRGLAGPEFFGVVSGPCPAR
ncbi:transposase domain-containing protein [Rhodococcus koreensis]